MPSQPPILHGVHAFLRDGDMVLLALERRTACWVLPGGHLENGETANNALCREFVEETGLTVEDAEFVYEIHLHRQGESPTARVVRYEVRKWSGSLLVDSPEMARVEFVSTDTAAQRLAQTPWFADAAEYLRGEIAVGSLLSTVAVGAIP